MLRVRCVGMNMWARPGASNSKLTGPHKPAEHDRGCDTSTRIHTPLSIQSVFLASTPSSIRFHTSSMRASGGGAVHPLKEPVRLRSLLSVIRMLVCGPYTASCSGFSTHAYMHACKHTRWHILTRAALHRFAHEYLLPSTCLSSGLRAFTRLCFPTHACVAIVPIASVMILPRLPALRVLRVIPACLVCVDLLSLSRVSGLLGVPG